MAQVQSALVGQSVCLVLKELTAGTQTSVGSAQSCVTPTSAWQPFPSVNYTVKTAGNSLTVNVLEKSAVSGANYSFDNVVLSDGLVSAGYDGSDRARGGEGECDQFEFGDGELDSVD